MDKYIEIRRPRNPAAIIALLPIMLMPVFKMKSEGFSLSHMIYAGSILLAAIPLLWNSFYQRRTPLLCIDGKSLVFFGYSPAQRKEFLLDQITRVKFFRRLNFWRSARLIAVEMNSEIHSLWIPCFVVDSTSGIHQVLKDQFQERYESIS